MTLGSQLGFDFNWVREAALGGLKGDIGLRLQMGINAAVGFSASGRCAVVVSRESEARALRLRFFRLRTRGLDASLNASLSVQARDSLLPGQIDDFIAAVFDTHGEQILRDLQILEKWTDPNRKLSDLIAEAGIDGAERLIAHLAGVPPERLQKEFDAVRDKALGFLDKWHGLPHRVASPLLKLVEQRTSRADVRAIATRLATITPEDLRSLLEDRLTRLEFLHTPAGRMLEAMAGGSALGLLSMPIDEVHAIAGRLLAVLDGAGTEDTLVRFQDFVERELRLDRIFKVVTTTDFAALDGLLKRKLAAFLDQHTVLLDDLEKVRKVIRLLLDKRDQYHEKALEVLHRQYEFSLNSTFSSTTSSQALLDATFDFSVDPARVTALFQQALQGNLDDLLLNQPPQVKLAGAQLTHGHSVQSHVTVSLPFTSSTSSHLNEVLASVEAVPDNGGLLFTVKASDTVASNERKGVLSLALGLAAAGARAGGVRLHQGSLEMNYSLVFARRNMQAKHVRTIVGPSLKAFFSRKIADAEEFIDLLDRQAEAVIPNGPNLLGNGLISLQVSMSATSAAKVGAAWLKLPKQRDADVYLAVSNAIQASLKRNIHEAFFSGPDAYTNAITTARIILAYCALVPRATSNFQDAADSVLGRGRHRRTPQHAAPQADRRSDDDAVDPCRRGAAGRFGRPVLPAGASQDDPRPDRSRSRTVQVAAERRGRYRDPRLRSGTQDRVGAGLAALRGDQGPGRIRIAAHRGVQLRCDRAPRPRDPVDRHAGVPGCVSRHRSHRRGRHRTRECDAERRVPEARREVRSGRADQGGPDPRRAARVRRSGGGVAAVRVRDDVIR